MVNHKPSDGTTPLNPDEAEGLIPVHITTQEQLNEWEAENILEGVHWASRQVKKDLLNNAFIRELHRRMFAKTWRWAGKFRLTEKNIGIAPESIAVELHKLLEDTKAQLETGSLTVEDIAVRFHHRLVFIHPFPNGNGRHARLMTNLLLNANDVEVFDWGRGDLVGKTEIRSKYLRALRSADKGDYSLLSKFVRSGKK